MGKKDGSKRVKGNMAPAASSRAAELLQQTGFGPTGFGGFGQVTEEYENMEGDLKVILKRLSKKDAITRIKALEDLNQYCTQAETDVLKPLVSPWATLFNRMATDVDPRVRSATLRVHVSLLTKLSRDFAPILKEIIGTWLITRFDPLKEVSGLSIQAFETAFPNKFDNCLKFAMTPIFEFCASVILDQTPESMSDPRYTTPDEMVAKYSRVVAGSFEVIHLMFDRLTIPENVYLFLLDAPGLWQKGQSEFPLVRTAFYKFVNQLPQKAPEMLETRKDLIAEHFVRKAFSERVCVAEMWSALLSIIRQAPELWDLASEKKPLSKKLLQYVKEGFHGKMKVSLPCLLPLLALLPEQTLLDSEPFYKELLPNLWSLGPNTDTQLVTLMFNTFYECWLFLSLSKAPKQLLDKVFKDGMKPLDDLLSEKSVLHLDTTSVLNAFVQHVDKFLVSKRADSERQEQLLNLVEESVLGVLDTQVLRSQEDQGKRVLDAVFALLEQLNDTNLAPVYDKFVKQLMATIRYQEQSEILLGLLDRILMHLQVRDAESMREFAFYLLELIPSEDLRSISVSVCMHAMMHLNDQKLWNSLISRIETLDSYSKLLLYPSIFKMVHESQLQTRFSLKSGYIDRNIMDWAEVDQEEPIEELIQVLGYLLAGDILDPSTVDKLATRAEFVLKSACEDLLVIPDHIHTISTPLAYLLRFVLATLSRVCEHKVLNVYPKYLGWILQLTTCHPESLAEITWIPEPPEDGLLEDIRKLSLQCFHAITSSINESTITAHLEAWIQELSQAFENTHHCMSPADLTHHLTLLADKMNTQQVKMVWHLLQDQEWHQEPFLQPPEPNFQICDPYLGWVPLLEQQELVDPVYDHDGLTQWTSRCLFVLGLLSNNYFTEHMAHSRRTFLELERFKIACQDRIMDPSLVALFQSSSGLDLHDLVAELNEALNASVLHPTDWHQTLQDYVTSHDFSLDRFWQCRSVQQHLRRSEVVVDVDSEDLLLNAALYMSTNMDRQDQFRIQVGHLLDAETHQDILKRLTIINHCAMKPFDMSEKLCMRLLKCARSHYDAHPITDRLVDGAYTQLIVKLLNYCQEYNVDLGSNMRSFLIRLNQSWLEEYCQGFDDASVVHLYHLLHMVEILNQLSQESEWALYKDQQEKRNDCIAQIWMLESEFAEFRIILEICAGLLQDIELLDIKRWLNWTRMYKLIYLMNEAVQKCDYQIMHQLIGLQVQQDSVQIEMNQELQFQFNQELIAQLQPGVQLLDAVGKHFGYLTLWMLLLDHFEDATFDLKSQYTEQLRDLNILDPLLRFVFSMLDVDGKAFKLDGWAFDEPYYMDGFDFEDSQTSVSLLSAHLYWRCLVAIPSLVRVWFTECKNRQLVLAVEQYTSQYYTPKLVMNEFKRLSNEDTEPLSIKVNQSTNELSCLYNIEDAVLDMNMKLPPTYPLSLVQVSSGAGGGKAAGIQEKRWRSWLLSVTSMLSAQNGSLMDAISLFKKNVSLHFQGIEDCAICYSVIGVIDRQLPTKQCRVCKHKFHGACLFKWFKSSHQNTCPLCRQPF